MDTGVFTSIEFDRVGFIDSIAGKVFCTDKFIIVITQQVVQFFDSKSFKFIGFSFQRHLSDDLVIPSKMSRKRNVLAVPRLTGVVDFYQTRPPETSLLWKVF